MSFILFTVLKTAAGQVKNKYPTSTNCDNFYAQYDETDLKAFAKLDEFATFKQHGAGYYQCYCKKYSKSDPNLCDMYTGDIRTAQFLTYLVMIICVIFNIVIRTLNMNLIDRIGYDTHSERYSAIMTSVFITSFINTGVLLCLTNANLKHTWILWIPIYNQFPDFTIGWFTQIGGSITQTLLIQAFMPWIEIGIALFRKWISRSLDSRKCCPRGEKTKKITNQQYIDLYSGPEYMMHFRYSAQMVMIYVAMMYGLFMPIIFFIALIGIFNMYVVERLALCYYYR